VEIVRRARWKAARQTTKSEGPEQELAHRVSLLCSVRAVAAVLSNRKVDASVYFAPNWLIQKEKLRYRQSRTSGFPEIRNQGVRIPERLAP
jgi:hypothetical protein